jgi:hypothetical protein
MLIPSTNYQHDEKFQTQSKKNFNHPLFRLFSFLFNFYRIRSFTYLKPEPLSQQGRMVCIML